MPLSPKTSQHLTTSWDREEIEKRCFRHLTESTQGFLVVKYLLLKFIVSLKQVHKVS
jgi:hypothetical protein